MKMIMIVYNEAIEMEVMEELERRGIKNYTKLMAIYGKGDTSGTHLGDDVWPGRNNILYIACEDPKAKEVMASVKTLRKDLGKEGVKAFLIPLEETT